jgi:adenylate cyclase
VRCAIEVQNGMIERNVGIPGDRHIQFRVAIHVGDVVEESDGDLMGNGVNIAARLECVAKPGAICLSEDAYRQVNGRLDLRVTDLRPTLLKNIAEPVRVYSLEVGLRAEAKSSASTSSVPRRGAALVPLAAGFGAILVVVASAAWHFAGSSRTTVTTTNVAPAEPAQAKHLSIVVLPFTNLSGDPAQDYFADGITDNLTTELSRIHDSFVIARNTAFSYKGKAVDAKAIGSELGVRYLLEGSVQREGTRVRVNAQLIDTTSGAHLWAQRFEGELGGLFQLQDRLVSQLANSLGNELIDAEARNGMNSRRPDAIDLTMQGWEALSHWWQSPRDQTPDSNWRTRNLFENALAIDPDEVDALVGDALTYDVEHEWGWRNSAVDYDAKVLGQSDRALAIAPGTAAAYAVKANYLLTTERQREAVEAADAGIGVNPNSALLYAVRAKAQIALGKFEQAKSDAQQAMRLSPHDPQIGWWHVALGDAEFGLGNYRAAIAEYQRDLEIGNHTDRYFDLASAYALAGMPDEARLSLEKARLGNPDLSIKSLEGYWTNLPRWKEGLRKAGLREE